MNSKRSWARAFAGRELAIATMHGKERVLAPLLEETLGVRCCLPGQGGRAPLDTDAFGTFRGDVPRQGTPREAARRKAIAAMACASVDLAVASEGTFAPHPDVPMLTIGRELVLLVDRGRELEIEGHDVTDQTNHTSRMCGDVDAAFAVANRVGFPDHNVILTVGTPPQLVGQDLRDHESLAAAFDAALASIAADEERAVRVASDMRADRNPTRMKAIDRAARDLLKRAATPCPECAAPGFGRVDVLRGLPCELCGLPTEWVRAELHACFCCEAKREMPRRDGRSTVDPGSCRGCNP
ncbi:MAG: DUF6671 family protein [Planctomycetota bacterium]